MFLLFETTCRKKHLIVGNHDNKWMACGSNLSDYFVSIDSLKEIQDDKGRHLILCHYPLMEWRGSVYAVHDKDKGNNFLIHGHLHHQKIFRMSLLRITFHVL